MWAYSLLLGTGLLVSSPWWGVRLLWKARYREGKVGDVEVKTKLATALNARLEPLRARRAEALARPGYLRDVLFEGSRKARQDAAEKMDRVRDAMKLKY